MKTYAIYEILLHINYSSQNIVFEHCLSLKNKQEGKFKFLPIMKTVKTSAFAKRNLTVRALPIRSFNLMRIGYPVFCIYKIQVTTVSAGFLLSLLNLAWTSFFEL